MVLSAFATITPKAEHLDDAVAAVRAIVPATRAEPGCLRFELHRGAGGGTLHLYEIWADRAAFDFHHAQEYVQAVYRRYADWLAAPVELVFMEPVA